MSVDTSPWRASTRRSLVSGALAAAISSAVAACGAESSRPLASGPVTLSLWTHDQGYQKFFAGGIAAADRTTPFHYRLRTMLAGPNDLVTKLLAQAVAGRGLPDLMGFERGSFPRMLRGDIAPRLLSDLRPAVATVPGLIDDLLTARTAPYTADGRLYALDSDTPLVVYHYRADLFARYGLPTDTTSWEELARIGEALHRRHGVSLGAVATGSNPGQVVQIFQILLEQRGGTFFDARQRLVVDSPEAAEVLEFLCTGLRTGFLTSVDDFYGGPMQAALKGGRIIGLPMASWYKAVMLLPNLAEQSGRWRIRTPPRFASGGHASTTVGGTGFGVLRGRSATKAATDFLMAAWLTRDAQLRRYRELGYLPTRRSVFADPSLRRSTDAYFGGQRPFDVYTPLLADIPSVHDSPDQTILSDVLGGYLLKAYRGALSPREALRRTAEDFRNQAGR